MRYEVNLTPYSIKSVYKSLDQTVCCFWNVLRSQITSLCMDKWQEHKKQRVMLCAILSCTCFSENQLTATCLRLYSIKQYFFKIHILMQCYQKDSSQFRFYARRGRTKWTTSERKVSNFMPLTLAHNETVSFKKSKIEFLSYFAQSFAWALPKLCKSYLEAPNASL